MKFIHTSDTHSAFIKLPTEGEVIIHTGDLLPNTTRGRRNIEINFQTWWVKQNIEYFKQWTDGRKFIFCEGNHDFIPVCDILNENGIDAINITNSFYEYKGIKIYGFPFINFMFGEWNRECPSLEMKRQVSIMMDLFHAQGTPDILAAHSPLSGILDVEKNISYGNSVLMNVFLYSEVPLPKLYLHGHVHESHGTNVFNGMLISNAATIARTLEL